MAENSANSIDPTIPEPTMKIDVLLFGVEASTLGVDRLTVQIPEDRPTCESLREAILEAAPSIRPHLQHWRISINHQFARADQRLSHDDEVAIIGLVSGG